MIGIERGRGNIGPMHSIPISDGRASLPETIRPIYSKTRTKGTRVYYMTAVLPCAGAGCCVGSRAGLPACVALCRLLRVSSGVTFSSPFGIMRSNLPSADVTDNWRQTEMNARQSRLISQGIGLPSLLISQGIAPPSLPLSTEPPSTKDHKDRDSQGN